MQQKKLSKLRRIWTFKGKYKFSSSSRDRIQSMWSNCSKYSTCEFYLNLSGHREGSKKLTMYIFIIIIATIVMLLACIWQKWTKWTWITVYTISASSKWTPPNEITVFIGWPPAGTNIKYTSSQEASIFCLNPSKRKDRKRQLRTIQHCGIVILKFTRSGPRDKTDPIWWSKYMHIILDKILGDLNMIWMQ